VLLALLALAIVAAALAAPLVFRAAESWSARRARGRRARRIERRELRDPGRERRAEQRARELLRSCVNDEEWGMYRDLGFIRVGGQMSRRRRASGDPSSASDEPSSGASDEPSSGASEPSSGASSDEPPSGDDEAGRSRKSLAGAIQGSERDADAPLESAADHEDPPYAYLIYPHKPIVAYVPKTGRLLSEYCVEFPDLSGAISQTRLPDSDDVLAKWMALTGDEERLIRNANMHLPGRQVDPGRIRRDLWRLSEWERQRRGYGPVRAPRT
jgi:hypothetical protein